MTTLRRFFTLDNLNNDLGLLIIRIVVGGSMLAFHGYGKITGGPESWTRIGGTMSNLGIDFMPVFWGFMAAISESLGSLLVIVGTWFRPALTLLAATMLVAAIRHLSLPADAAGAGLKGASHAIEMLAVFVGLYFTGPGKHRVGTF